MSPESRGADAPNHDPFTVDEYVKIHELSGQSVGELLRLGPKDQVSVFCNIATKEYVLHGDASFVTKSLDAAAERVPDIEQQAWGTPHVNRYMEVARTAYATEQSPDYVQALLDKALGANEDKESATYVNIAAAALETGQPADYVKVLLNRAFDEALAEEADSNEFEQTRRLDDIAAIAHASGQDPEYMEELADHLYAVSMMRHDLVAQAEALESLLKSTVEWDLGDSYRAGLIDNARQYMRTLEDQEERAMGLMLVAGLTYETGGEPAYLQDVLDETRAEIAKVEDGANRNRLFCGLAAVALKSEGQPQAYTEVFLELALEDEVEPGTIIDNIQHTIDYFDDEASEDSGEPQFRDLFHEPVNIEVLLQRIVSSGHLPERQKHMLLNRSLRLAGDPETLPEGFLDKNGVEKRPFSYVFSRTA
jgi:hypothetical protein